MNEGLNAIGRRAEGPITPAERDLLDDYFNLCAEEFLFYRLGYIVPEAWTAWEQGMRHHLRCPQIHDAWVKESKSGSYYGLEPILSRRLEAPGDNRRGPLVESDERSGEAEVWR